MLNGGEIIVKDNRKYLFCGFEKKRIQERSKEADIGYSIELIVLGRLLPQLREKGLVELLGVFNGSFISLNDNGELDDNSEYVEKVCTILSDDAVIGYMKDYEHEINFWFVKRTLVHDIQLPNQEFYTSEETIEWMNKYVKIYDNMDESVLATFIRDFVKLYKNTPYYDTLYKKYEKYFYVSKCFSYDFGYDRHHFVYAHDNMFYFIYKNQKNVCLHKIQMDKFDEVLEEFAMRSSSIPLKDSVVMEKVWGYA